MTAKAFAKINIGLQIVEKRDDGYHDIDTVFHRVELHDILHFSSRERGITISTNNTDLPTDESNLCFQACQKLFNTARYDRGVHIEIEKSIPIGAGLGGGSSDTAATLLALNKYFDLGVPTVELTRIAGSIGSDVPYFMEQGSAHASGTGDILSYFSLDLPYYILLVSPGIHISTPWAYRSFRPDPSLPIVNLKKTLLNNLDAPHIWRNSIRNDFEPIVFNNYTEIMHVKEELFRAGAAFSLMSGSGSSVFGVFKEEQTAQETADILGRKYECWITVPGFTDQG